MKNISQKKGGFTLIELLVVIAIIALLTGIVMTNLTGAKAKSRDAKRISDVGNIQLALELFFDRCKHYPAGIDRATPCEQDSAITFGTYMNVIPTDPSTGLGYVYDYEVDTSTSLPNMYVLIATLEGYSSVLKDDVDGQTPQTIQLSCGAANNGDGTNERIYCLTSN